MLPRGLKLAELVFSLVKLNPLVDPFVIYTPAQGPYTLFILKFLGVFFAEEVGFEPTNPISF